MTAPSLWRDRRFCTFWSAQAVSQFGDRVTELALPLIAVAFLHEGVGVVGALTAAVWLPNLLSLFVGVWVDARTHKRRLLVIADLLRAVVLFSLPVAYAFGAVTIGQLFVVAVLAGAGQVLFDMVYPSFFVALVPSESFLDANGKLSTTRSASFVAGPAVGGALISALSAPVAVAVDAVSFLFSAATVGSIRTPEAPPADDHQASMGERIVTGMRYVSKDRILRASLGSSATMNFFMFVAQALIILFANRDLHLSAGEIGIALGAGAGGGMLTAMLATRISKLLGAGRSIMVGTAMFTAPVALLCLAGGPHWLGMLLLAATETLSSIGVMLYDINNNSLRAAVTPDAVRSRIAGAYNVVNYGSRPVGALIGGWLGTEIGIRPTLLVAAVGGVLGVLWLVRSPIATMTAIPVREEQPVA